MTSKKTESPTSEPVHVLDIINSEWEVSRKSVKMNDLVVRHDVEPPDQIPIVLLSKRSLIYQDRK